MIPNKTNSKYAVPALDKGLDIIEFLVEQSLPKSQTEIAQGLGRSANEIYRVLVGLESRGYLLRDEASGHYRVSLKLYNLSRSISPIDKVRQCALPLMEDLAVSIGQSCHLSMLYQSQTMVIVQARSHSPVSINISEGSLFPTTKTTSGLILLANSNPDVRDMILERDGEFQLRPEANKAKLFDELSMIREQGYYSAKSQFTEGVCDVAALIGEPDGLVIASLAVSSINTSISDSVDSDEITTQVIETANKITELLGVNE